MINLPKEVYNLNTPGDSNHFNVVSVVLLNQDDDHIKLEYTEFITNYEEYFDPKDLRIKALEDELNALKLKHRPVRKKFKRLTPLDIKEIKVLIANGETNPVIAKEYDCSESRISSIRVEVRNAETK